MGPNEFVSPQVRADRIWAKLAAMPLPTDPASRREPTLDLFRAIREELGAVHVGLLFRDGPVAVEALPFALNAEQNIRVISSNRVTGESREISDGGDFSEQVVREWARNFKFAVEDADVWSQHLVHGELGYGILLLCRVKSKDGPVTEADRAVVYALSDRLAERLYQWETARTDRPEESE